jgi:hypothetical protein
MKLRIRCLVLLLCTLLPFSGNAQNTADYRLLLRTGSFTPEKNVSDNTGTINRKTSPADDRSFVIIQFEKIPDQNERQQLGNEGIELLDYIPNYAYTATVKGSLNGAALRNTKARAIVNLTAEQKMQPGLANGNIPPHAVIEAGTVDVWISFPRSFTFDQVQAGLKNSGFSIISDLFKNYEILTLRVPAGRLKELALLPFVQYVQAIPQKDKTLNDVSTANSRANVLTSSLPGGRGLNGKGVVVGVGDESNPLQHIDFSGRIINRNAREGGAHGIHVMGTLGGAGIINEKYKGYAPGATIVAQENSNILALAPAYVKDYGMVITNNSYGGDLNNCSTFGVYDLYSYILDRQAFQMPFLQHVFAAGNSGSTACSPYPTGFANVLSGYQTAKNVISVGNTTQIGELGASSSRGPVRDGRIKPEITAQGTSVASTFPVNQYFKITGTSMASPAVSGGLALLYQRFRQLHNTNPKNGLMKALLVNGGTDKGNDGPDYKYGFGGMNLLRSVRMMEDNAYLNDSLSHQQTKVHNIQVPANTAQLKVMLYWNDPAAAMLSGQNLVHDLDLSVTSPASVSTLPKLLDPTPLNVNNPAVTGVDKVNNIEQVVINNPPAGNYAVTVKGSAVVQNPFQEYFLVYDAIPAGTAITYPLGNERLRSGDTLYVSWESSGDAVNTFNVEYSLNNGIDWQNIGTGLSADTRQVRWIIPGDITTDKAKVRVIQNGINVRSDSQTFTIMGIPQVTLSAIQCEGYIGIDWTAVTGATAYEVMMLKGDEMVSEKIVNADHYVFNNLSRDSTYWVSVRAMINGSAGRRAVAISRKPDSGTCEGSISDRDLKIEAIVSPQKSGRQNTSTALSGSTAVTIRIKNLDDVSSSGEFSVAYSVNGVNTDPEIVSQAIPAGGSIEYTFSERADLLAVNHYEIAVFLIKADDPVPGNNTLIRSFRQLGNEAVSLPFFDNLETLPEQTYTGEQSGFSGSDRYDFTTASDAGRIRTFVNSGMAFSGSKAFTLDASRYFAPGISGFLDGTFNLSGYNISADDVRLDFRFKNHGQKSHPDNKVWIRASETDEWIEAYDLNANQNLSDEGYKLSASIEISNLLAERGKQLTPGLQVRWGQWGQKITADNMSGAGYSIDDIQLYIVNNDVQLVKIISPVPENCGLGQAETISVSVRNSSASNLSNIPVTYSLSSGIEVTETIPLIEPRSNLIYHFAAKADLSGPGAQSVRIWVALAEDDFKSNDTLKMDFRSAAVISSFPYFQNFENGDGSWYSEGKNNSWKYGTPGSAKISRAASGSKAWKTNLTGNYQDKEASYLYSPCFVVSGMSAPALSFSLALDLEVCGSDICDVAYVEYSGDAGPWERLGTSGAGTNWYTKNSEGKGIWNVANYTRWHVASIPLPTGFTNIKLRFVLKSDPFSNREGIAIDDIHMYNHEAGIYDEVTMAAPVTQAVSNGSDWVDFTKNGKLIASVQPANQNLGNTDVQAYIHGGAVRNTSEQFYLNRNVTMKPSNGNLTNPATVRLYFLDSEVEQLLNAEGCPGCIKPAQVSELGVSKYTGNDRSGEDGEFYNSTEGSWSFLASPEVTIVPFDKGYYAEMQISSFSEFWFSKNLLGTADALPVKLTAFTAKRKSGAEVSDDVVLVWTTASEENFDHFEIEVAIESENVAPNHFTKIADVPGKGGTGSGQKYTFTDAEPLKSGYRYYRLKMVDLDGTYGYSGVRLVKFSDQTRWQIYPNPSDGSFNVAFQDAAGSQVSVKVYDLTGRLHLEKRFVANGLVQQDKLNLAALAFSSGIYLIEINSAGKKETFRVFKK